MLCHRQIRSPCILARLEICCRCSATGWYWWIRADAEWGCTVAAYSLLMCTYNIGTRSTLRGWLAHQGHVSAIAYPDREILPTRQRPVHRHAHCPLPPPSSTQAFVGRASGRPCAPLPGLVPPFLRPLPSVHPAAADILSFHRARESKPPQDAGLVASPARPSSSPSFMVCRTASPPCGPVAFRATTRHLRIACRTR